MGEPQRDQASGTTADEKAVVAFQAGDRAAFDQLVHRHQQRIYGLALKMTGAPDEALDVCQESFVKALGKLGSLQNPQYFGTWLYRIALNTAISQLRKRGREAENPQVLEREGKSGEPTPSHSLGQKERREMVQAALAELPEAQRVAIVLCDLEGQSYEAIATLLDISKGTVMSRIHYGRRKLRERLSRYLDQ